MRRVRIELDPLAFERGEGRGLGDIGGVRGSQGGMGGGGLFEEASLCNPSLFYDFTYLLHTAGIDNGSDVAGGLFGS